MEAVRQDDAATLRLWLARRPGLAGLILPDGTSPVTLAARLGHNAALAALLEAGVAAWTVESDPEGPPTAMMLAAARGDAEAVVLLLEHGADPALRDRHGRSAADWARAQGHAELAARLEAGSEAERLVWSGAPTDQGAGPAMPAGPGRATPGAAAR